MVVASAILIMAGQGAAIRFRELAMIDENNVEAYAARMRLFLKNRQEFPDQELAKYAGQWVAWSLDGTQIVAGSHQSEEALCRDLEAAGRNPLDYLLSYVDAGDEGII
jgi:hypothetical protein